MKSVGPFYTLEPINRFMHSIDALHEPLNLPMKPIHDHSRFLIIDMIDMNMNN